MKTAASPQPTVDETIRRISLAYESLSNQLQAIARYVEKNRDRIGIEGIREFAQQCGVQPSAIVRFSKRFGFSGFSELQAMFRENLYKQLSPEGCYTARIRNSITSANHIPSTVEVAKDFLEQSISGMRDLQDSMNLSTFQNAVELLSKTDCVWIAASHRSFPIAAYLEYALQHTDKRVMLVDTKSSMHMGQMHSVRKNDVILAISFLPYAEETLAVARNAIERGAHLIVITDSGLSPLAQLASVALVVHETTSFGFRSLCNAMGLAQSLFVSLAYSLELSKTSP
ncbi:MurR/RpiR family transcriptional regulator [Rhodoferax sp. GW822-FHT02A01]|uniref:MurR/RpiR family transcriptional regulator n=1 Tax=Rhodoferax sp. GW822-FHT02A01 TaxID=3141537 RepID=UPI00315DE65B